MANPALATLDSQQKYVTKLEKDVVGYLGRSYRSRTCDTLIKRYRPYVPPSNST